MGRRPMTVAALFVIIALLLSMYMLWTRSSGTLARTRCVPPLTLHRLASPYTYHLRSTASASVAP